MFSPLVEQLISALRVLPSVGPKSAQRMALYLLERDREGALALSQALAQAASQVGRCEKCRTFTEQPTCTLCLHSKRNQRQICVVETPADVLALEQTGIFSGVYFVLHGRLSPLDGLGPSEIGMDTLAQRLQSEDIEEVIVATNPTLEGEATAHYLAQLCKSHCVKISRIAHGVPIGGELEYIDGGTLAHALSSRREL